MSTSSRVSLISNSTLHGRGYLDHVEQALRDFRGNAPDYFAGEIK